MSFNLILCSSCVFLLYHLYLLCMYCCYLPELFCILLFCQKEKHQKTVHKKNHTESDIFKSNSSHRYLSGSRFDALPICQQSWLCGSSEIWVTFVSVQPDIHYVSALECRECWRRYCSKKRTIAVTAVISQITVEHYCLQWEMNVTIV